MHRDLLTHALGILLVLTAVSALMALLSVYQRRCHPDPELVRKLMHMGSGMIAASFPWVFGQIWPVLLLATMSFTGMLAVRHLRSLNRACGDVLGGVKRQSLGELYFPMAVGLLFVLTRGEPVAYLVPILVLTFADTAAALVGIRFGRIRFRTLDGTKSVEGCAAFFAVAVLCAALPLAATANVEPVQILLISVFVGVVLAVVEAVSWAGIDNLTVPVVGVFVFEASRHVATEDLASYLSTLGVVAGLMLLWHVTRLIGTGGMGNAEVGLGLAPGVVTHRAHALVQATANQSPARTGRVPHNPRR